MCWFNFGGKKEKKVKVSKADKIKADGYNTQGLTFEYAGNFTQALQCFEEALKIVPCDENYRINRDSVKERIATQKIGQTFPDLSGKRVV